MKEKKFVRFQTGNFIANEEKIAVSHFFSCDCARSFHNFSKLIGFDWKQVGLTHTLLHGFKNPTKQPKKSVITIGQFFHFA